MNALGGYFELEPAANAGGHFHRTAERLNTGRCCFEYVLRSRGYRFVHIPYYTCQAILEPIERLGIRHAFYRVDEHLDPLFDQQLGDDQAILYTNYFGLKSDTVGRLARRFGNRLIVDNVQAFFEPPLDGIDTFYSARKFFGVPDGAYLYTDRLIDRTWPVDRSADRMSHLLKRLEQGAEAGYDDFKRNDEALSGDPIRQMSKLTDRLLCGIDYVRAATRRKANFTTLAEALDATNLLNIPPLREGAGPLVYPYYSAEPGLRRKLLERKVFVATYWPNVAQWAEEGTLDRQLSTGILPLPIDQRYDRNDMEVILKIIKS